MARAKHGDTVKVHYTGRLDDGTVFDSSSGRAPMEFTIGADQVIPGFEQAVVGMNPGDTKTTTAPPDEAYGPRRDEMVVAVPQEQFPSDFTPELGQELEIQQRDGRIFMVRVTDVSESAVTLDANHPLAGKDLTFDIELVEIVVGV